MNFTIRLIKNLAFFLFIASSHLTKKTERPPLPAADTQRCIVTRPQSNVTLLGGIKSGIFSEANHVHDMDLCTRHCCLKGDCDLAFMIRDSCYLVKCGNEMLCKTKKARPSNMNPRISFVTRLAPIKFQPRELLCFLNEVFALHAFALLLHTNANIFASGHVCRKILELE